MTKKITSLLTLFSALLISQFSFADPTEDLWKALKGNNAQDALTAIAAGADVKNLDSAFGSPLNFASCWTSAEVVKALIDAKSDVNFVAAANGYTPLMNAAVWGNIDAMKLLLTAGADPKATSPTGNVLSAAIMSSKGECIQLIIDAGANVNTPYLIKGNPTYKTKDMEMFPFTTFCMSYKSPAEKTAGVLATKPYLEKMGLVLPNSITEPSEKNYTSEEDATDIFIKAGADIKTKTALGTPFEIATRSKKLGIASRLGGSISASTKGADPDEDLIDAIKYKDLAKLEKAIAAGAKVNRDFKQFHMMKIFGSVNIKSCTPLVYAVINDFYDGALELLRNKAKPNEDTKITGGTYGSCNYDSFKEVTAIYYAIDNQNIPMIKLLIQGGADPYMIAVGTMPKGYVCNGGGMFFGLKRLAKDLNNPEIVEIIKEGRKAMWAAGGLPPKGGVNNMK
ncbi:ankyrin repeat domain-containing protein [Flavobacterium psychrotolerans]|uniref:Uncharacterized protein n=1 Tax=Flavobacterium psychrotolerans TaxID=2169410 RepID=A0A2U1JL45_9FLAO|nr:ankyrin repeat domain-containing protein [Flavobacterium psychrotolerans]PWA05578.1 hypothetical protein DB895_06225 [Flavobacterium psychrotolerans]